MARQDSTTRWFEEAFRSDYRRVYSHRDLPAARAEAGFLVECGVSGRVLDLCCGFGRHTLALAEAGVDVFGLDLSAELLRESHELPGSERLDGRLVRADAISLPFRPAAFDSVVNLFSSFGYFGELGDARMLEEMARVLRPDGFALMDLMNPPVVRANLQAESHREGDHFLLRERRALADGGRRVVKDVELRFEEGEARRWREDVRLYELTEMRSLLADRGFEVSASWGGFDGSELSDRSARMILGAIRR